MSSPTMPARRRAGTGSRGWQARQHDAAQPMAAPRPRGLFACPGEVREYRRARGRRYPLASVQVTLASR